MHSLKRCAALAFVAFALSAIGVASAAAASFTYSATGVLSGKALNTQTFTTSTTQLKCTTAETSGTITSTNFSEQHFTVNYKGCTFSGFVGVDVSPATYVLTASGKAHLKSAITINVTGAGCHQTIGAQEFGSVSYVNNGSKLQVVFNGSGIAYTTTGGFCGAAGKGSLAGTIEIERVGGGTVAWDA